MVNWVVNWKASQYRKIAFVGSYVKERGKRIGGGGTCKNIGI